jgi:hypothetical protein
MKRVNKTEMAGILGITLKTFEEWINRGAPAIQEGNQTTPWIFDTAAVIKFVRQYDKEKSQGSDLQQLKKRKAAAEADLMELKAGAEAGELVKIDDVIRELIDDYINLKNRFMQLPKRLPPMLMGETPESMKAIIQDEVHAVFYDIKNRFIVERGQTAEINQAGKELPDATAAAHGQRVG